MRRTRSTSITQAGRTMFEVRLTCECGWGTRGSNTFSSEYLEVWADGMEDWHKRTAPEGVKCEKEVAA